MSDQVKYTSILFNKRSQLLPECVAHVHTEKHEFKDNKIPSAFAHLLELIGNKDVNCEDWIKIKFENKLGTDTMGGFDPEVAKAFKRLADLTKSGIQAAYDKGKEDGKRALVMLNQGEITLDQFEKK